MPRPAHCDESTKKQKQIGQVKPGEDESNLEIPHRAWQTRLISTCSAISGTCAYQARLPGPMRNLQVTFILARLHLADLFLFFRALIAMGRTGHLCLSMLLCGQ